MRVVHRVRELQHLADAERAAGRRVALVPTMGALHEAHLALVDAARRRADTVVLSVFVNPTQFGPGEDFAAYPRALEADCARAQERGVDVLFAPGVEELYPPGEETRVEVPGLSAPLCGSDRPGHFCGVATVVTKLLVAARPHVAVFGEKDHQQLVVIRRLVRDLGFDVEVVGHPIVREADGLALSSRNAYLDARTRPQSLALVAALDAAERALGEGERRREALLARVGDVLAKAPDAKVDYAELRDPETLAPAPERLEGPTLLALAVRFPPPAGRAGPGPRLLDNRVLEPGPGRATTVSSERSQREAQP